MSTTCLSVSVFQRHENDILRNPADMGETRELMIDHFEKVTDVDGAIMTRKLALEEGIFVGYSCGSAMAGLLQLQKNFKEDDVVVIIFHDHGSRYVAKVFNDDWMEQQNFLSSYQSSLSEQQKTALTFKRDYEQLIPSSCSWI